MTDYRADARMVAQLGYQIFNERCMDGPEAIDLALKFLRDARRALRDERTEILHDERSG